MGCKGCFCPIIQTTNILPILEMGSTPSPNPTIPQQPVPWGPFPPAAPTPKASPNPPFQIHIPLPRLSPIPYPLGWQVKDSNWASSLAKAKVGWRHLPLLPTPGLTVYGLYKKTTPHWIRRCFKYGYTTGKINTHAQTVSRDQCMLLPHHSHSPPRPCFCNLLPKCNTLSPRLSLSVEYWQTYLSMLWGNLTLMVSRRLPGFRIL